MAAESEHLGLTLYLVAGISFALAVCAVVVRGVLGKDGTAAAAAAAEAWSPPPPIAPHPSRHRIQPLPPFSPARHGVQEAELRPIFQVGPIKVPTAPPCPTAPAFCKQCGHRGGNGFYCEGCGALVREQAQSVP